jgi:hypothetical protein
MTSDVNEMAAKTMRDIQIRVCILFIFISIDSSSVCAPIIPPHERLKDYPKTSPPPSQTPLVSQP